MQPIIEQVQQGVRAALSDGGWLTTPMAIVMVLGASLMAFVILTSMTLPPAPRRPRSLRARLHLSLLTATSSLAAWLTLGMACVALWRMGKLLSQGPGAAWQAYLLQRAGQAEALWLAASLVIALVARWHREAIAGTSHFTLSHVLHCQALRAGFLAAPLLLAGIVQLP